MYILNRIMCSYILMCQMCICIFEDAHVYQDQDLSPDLLGGLRRGWKRGALRGRKVLTSPHMDFRGTWVCMAFSKNHGANFYVAGRWGKHMTSGHIPYGPIFLRLNHQQALATTKPMGTKNKEDFEDRQPCVLVPVRNEQFKNIFF